MKYAALLTNNADDVTAWEQLSSEEAAAARAEEVPKWEALFGELGPTGALGAGFELDSPKTAKTVRVRGGETLVTDGPFAETKEQIGGLMEIEAEDLDAAIAIAARIPVVFRASVELRPVIEH
ncbi:MAG TPA: YciI family protein [Gaiellaceae bacterium]|nr:YciI family protein [Gaiellaceae bacterium]